MSNSVSLNNVKIDLIARLDGITSGEITERLSQIEAERRALGALLRSVRARESCRTLSKYAGSETRCRKGGKK